MILNKKNMRNKKVILILCLLVLVSGSVQAQRLKAVQNEKGRYGFMTEDGTVVIKYKYDEATTFKDGIAKIGKDGKYSHRRSSHSWVSRLRLWANPMPWWWTTWRAS